MADEIRSILNDSICLVSSLLLASRLASRHWVLVGPVYRLLALEERALEDIWVLTYDNVLNAWTIIMELLHSRMDGRLSIY